MADARLDAESAGWLGELRDEAPARTAAVDRLHALLLRVTRAEAGRRRDSLPERAWEEVDDLCREAANDALLAVLRKLPEFRAESRFTTWACKFAILEISTRLRRHAWRQRRVEADASVWDRLADAAPPTLDRMQWRQTLELLQRAVREQLTERQRLVFEGAVLGEVPIDVLAERLETTRGAIYKVLHDARARLRRVIAQAEQEQA